MHKKFLIHCEREGGNRSISGRKVQMNLAMVHSFMQKQMEERKLK